MSTARAIVTLALALVVSSLCTFGADEVATVVEVNTARQEALASLPGLTEELAAGIVKWREENGPFDTPEEVGQVPGITDEILASILDRLRALPLPTDGPDTGQPAIIALANYFSQFEGIDVSKLPLDDQRTFLDMVNREQCMCGCAGDTMARCYVNDPGCAVAKARLQTLYRQMLAEAKAAAPTDPE